MTDRPRLGFLGLGWIGRNRMQAIQQSGVAEIAVIAEPVAELAHQAAAVAPEAAVVSSLAELLEHPLDGVVIATPSALHAEQSIMSLRQGLAVFCQKPLGRNAAETEAVINAARSNNRLLHVDLSYRVIDGVPAMRHLIQSGDLGMIYAADLVFHNAYGPDKPWFYDARLSGGGCVIDLGIHLVDLALWALDWPTVAHVHSRLYAGGELLDKRDDRVEDFAVALLDTTSGAALHVACSWRLPIGRDAQIEAAFYGTQGGVALRNVAGSFYDFTVQRFNGTTHEVISAPPDDWGGRALIEWATRLTTNPTFDPSIAHLTMVAATLDRIYQRV